jgi:D-3-phosphoglycerate dehydrogenase
MGKKFKVLLYESMHSEGTALLEEKCDLIYARSYDEKDLIAQVSDVNAVIIRANGAVTQKIIEAAPKLKVIGRHGVGLDAIDLEAGSQGGVYPPGQQGKCGRALHRPGAHAGKKNKIG